MVVMPAHVLHALTPAELENEKIWPYDDVILSPRQVHLIPLIPQTSNLRVQATAGEHVHILESQRDLVVTGARGLTFGPTVKLNNLTLVNCTELTECSFPTSVEFLTLRNCTAKYATLLLVLSELNSILHEDSDMHIHLQYFTAPYVEIVRSKSTPTVTWDGPTVTLTLQLALPERWPLSRVRTLNINNSGYMNLSTLSPPDIELLSAFLSTSSNPSTEEINDIMKRITIT